MPRLTPNQSVQNRIMIVAAAAVASATCGTSSRSSPVLEASETPSPPGRNETRPKSVEAAKMKVATSKRWLVPACPKPLSTYQKARHSPNHETTLNTVETSSSRQEKSAKLDA